MEATISTWNRFSKIFRAWKVLRHFRNYFANPNHPELWQPFLTFGIIAKFSEPFRDFGISFTHGGSQRFTVFLWPGSSHTFYTFSVKRSSVLVLSPNIVRIVLLCRKAIIFVSLIHSQVELALLLSSACRGCKGYQVRGTQGEYSSKPLKHSFVKRILVFKR